MKIVIFDFDGVLFDSIDLSNKFISELYPGISIEEINEVLKGNFFEEIKKTKYLQISETNEDYNNRIIKYTALKLNVKINEGIEKLLNNLKTLGFTLLINTSSRKQNCIPLLEKYNLLIFFDNIFTSEISKSKIEKFNLIKEEYKIKNKKDIVFITDTLGDLLEAKKSDINTIAITWGAHDSSFFRKEETMNLISICSTCEELYNRIIRYFSES